MEEFDEIVHLHTRVGLGRYLEDQWRGGVFQSVLLICKDKEEVRVNPLILSLLFPWLTNKMVISRDDVILLPEFKASTLNQQIEQLLRSEQDVAVEAFKEEVKVEAVLIEGSKQQVDPPPPADSESDDGDVIDNSDDIDFEEEAINEKKGKPQTGEDFKPAIKQRNTEKRSAAWQFYTVISADQASCLQCSSPISTKLGSTKGLITHIKSRHPPLYQQFINQKTKKNQKEKTISDSPGQETAIACTVCDRKLSNESILTECPDKTCGARFHPACLLDPASCSTCQTKIKSKYRLCTECGKSVQNMSKHLKMHRGIKPERLQCHVCEKTLCSANALKVHIETIHEGIRRFTCKFCENTFIYASHLKRHILVVHYNYKNPKAICPDCGKQFKFISTMKRHRRVSHLGEVVRKRHFCPQCKQVFYKESQLTGHLRDQHGFIPSRRKTVRSRENLVEKSCILAEYPELVKPQDLDFNNQLLE